MRRGLWCGVVWSAVLATALAQPVALQEDPLLQRRITVWLKLEPMRDALRFIARQTGVPLRCQDAIAEEKVAIFVENRPAHEILTQLARVFRYEWRQHEAGGYILYVPDETRLAEEQVARAVLEARRKAVMDLVQAARKVRQMSLQQRQEALRALQQDSKTPSTPEQAAFRTALRHMTPSELQPTTDGQPARMEVYHSSYAVLHALAALPERAVQALLNGQTIGLSTKPAAGVYALPDDALLPAPHMRDLHVAQRSTEKYDLGFSPRNPEFAGVWMRLCSRMNAIEYQLVSVSTTSLETIDPLRAHQRQTLKHAEATLSLDLAPYLRGESLPREWSSWATPREVLLESIPERFSPTEERPLRTPPAYRCEGMVNCKFVTTADALELLAWTTRRPIVSDAFRLAKVWYEPTHQYAPRMLLTNLLASCQIRADEVGYWLVRHRSYLSYRKYELPEAWLRPLEQKYEQQRWLTLDDYIALAGKLSDAQAEFLVQGREYHPILLVRFEIEPLISCLPALRFLAALTPAQRQALSAGQWLPYSRLNAAQRRLFQRAASGLFPPAQQLFREPLPPVHSTGFANLTAPRWAGYASIVPQNVLAELLHTDTVSEPAVRLQSEKESLLPFVLSPEGVVSRTFEDLSYVPLTQEYIEQYIQPALNSRPGSRLMAARVRRVNIVFLVEQGKPKIYQFVLWQPEPFEWPPPKADSQQL